jgi:hypothetical protein
MDAPVESPHAAAGKYSVTFIPLVTLAASWAIWTVFQMVMLINEGGNLKTLRANQENTVQQANKLRAQLDSIAAKTAELAAAGNTNAQTIVNELRRRGVTINPTAAKPPAKPPEK